MTSLLIGLGLAIMASVALNVSYLMQHAGSRHAPELSARRPLASLRSLLTSRWWLLGGAAGLAGWALHAGALAHAPLSLVQAFTAGGLALTVPVAACLLGQRLAPAELVAVGVLVLAVPLLGVAASAPALTAVPVVPLAVSLVIAVLASVSIAARARGRRRAQALGAAGGVLYGAADAATKAVTVVAHRGLSDALVSPWLAVVVVLSVGAFTCFQRGLQQRRGWHISSPSQPRRRRRDSGWQLRRADSRRLPSWRPGRGMHMRPPSQHADGEPAEQEGQSMLEAGEAADGSATTSRPEAAGSAAIRARAAQRTSAERAAGARPHARDPVVGRVDQGSRSPTSMKLDDRLAGYHQAAREQPPHVACRHARGARGHVDRTWPSHADAQDLEDDDDGEVTAYATGGDCVGRAMWQRARHVRRRLPRAPCCSAVAAIYPP